MKNPETAKPYEWDWDGEYVIWKDGEPKLNKYISWWGTFSVGVFQWVPTKDGKRLKRAKAIKRIRGYLDYPLSVFRRAQDMVDDLNKEEQKNL